MQIMCMQIMYAKKVVEKVKQQEISVSLTFFFCLIPNFCSNPEVGTNTTISRFYYTLLAVQRNIRSTLCPISKCSFELNSGHTQLSPLGKKEPQLSKFSIHRKQVLN